MQKIAGLILANGQSKRMGQDKADLIYEGKTLLEHLKSTISDAGIENVLINDKANLRDEIKQKGPLSGIHAGIVYAIDKYNYLVIIPVDMPNVDTTLINDLMASDVSVDVVKFTTHIMPFKIRITQKILSELEYCLNETTDYSIVAFLRRVSVKELDISHIAEQKFTNINTYDDWHKFFKQL